MYSYQGHMDGELHSNAHRGDENDHRDSTQLDPHQPHEAKQLHSHERQYQHLKGNGEFLLLERNMIDKSKALLHLYSNAASDRKTVGI